ncbi:hypothetical protein STEG23_014636, partial [Scotinomys teguina]
MFCGLPIAQHGAFYIVDILTNFRSEDCKEASAASLVFNRTQHDALVVEHFLRMIHRDGYFKVLPWLGTGISLRGDNTSKHGNLVAKVGPLLLLSLIIQLRNLWDWFAKEFGTARKGNMYSKATDLMNHKNR